MQGNNSEIKPLTIPIWADAIGIDPDGHIMGFEGDGYWEADGPYWFTIDDGDGLRYNTIGQIAPVGVELARQLYFKVERGDDKTRQLYDALAEYARIERVIVHFNHGTAGDIPTRNRLRNRIPGKWVNRVEAIVDLDDEQTFWTELDRVLQSLVDEAQARLGAA